MLSTHRHHCAKHAITWQILDDGRRDNGNESTRMNATPRREQQKNLTKTFQNRNESGVEMMASRKYVQNKSINADRRLLSAKYLWTCRAQRKRLKIFMWRTRKIWILWRTAAQLTQTYARSPSPFCEAFFSVSLVYLLCHGTFGWMSDTNK